MEHSPEETICQDIKQVFNKFKIILKVTQTMFSDHSRLKLETSKRMKPGKSPSIWKLSRFLNSP